MLKMFHYMKERWYYLVMILLLLFVQAFCDLSLPDYTSDIINVGIQQKGIEDGVPEKLREESADKLFLFMDQEDREQVQEDYTLTNGMYELKDISSEEREELNNILGVPELIVTGLSDPSSKEVAQIKEQMGLDQDADIFQILEQIPKEQLSQMLSGMEEQFEQMPDSIVTQSAVLFVQDEYSAQGQDLDQMQMHYILLTGGKMLGLAFLGMAAAITVTFLSARVAATLGRNLRNSVYRKVLSFSGAELNHFSTASLITRSTNDVQQIQLLFAMIFRIVLYAPILGIGGVYKVFQTDASMTWILALAVIVIMLFVGLLFKIAMPKFTKLQYLIDNLNLVAREILTGVYVIRAFSTEKHEEERFEDANYKLMKTNLFVNRCMTFMMPVMMLIMNGITVLIVWNGSHAVDEGTMQVGNMMAFMQYAMQIIMAFLMITMMSIMIPRAGVSAKRINEVMETEVSIQDGENHTEPSADRKGEVVFDHVGFAYNTGETVLKDVSFTAKQGEVTALVGPSGGGKTTVSRLAARFWDVSRGKITVGGMDTSKIDPETLLSLFSIVFQDVTLFDNTILENIRIGNKDATDEQVLAAARLANVDEFAEKLPDGWHTNIGENGCELSGGERQRISIARAFLKNAPIILLDEATASLDVENETLIQTALSRLIADKTVLVIAHRMRTVAGADKIVVLSEGTVAEEGAPETLLKQNGLYARMVKLQTESQNWKLA